METNKIISAVIGGVIAGFSMGAGFLIAQRTMGNWAYKKSQEKKDEVTESVAQSVKDGVKEALNESQENFSGRQPQRRRPQKPNYFMGFDGNPMMMASSSNPYTFQGTPNSALNTF